MNMRGIDAQIKRRMMQDPRRLQQNYKQNRDILDLIALQMIKSEKDQKKKDMMLKMQDNPATIKQQMEQDLVRQTKDDLVKQTSGIMQIQNAQKNKNLQKILASAGKGRRPPMTGMAQRRQPPMTGITQPFNRPRPKTPTMANPLAVGLARAPAPNMQGMTRRAAQGGIVGFHTGNQVAAMGGKHTPNDHTHLTGGPNYHGYGQVVDEDSLAGMLKKKLFPPPPPPTPIQGGMGEGQIDTNVGDMIKKGKPEAYLENELDTIKESKKVESELPKKPERSGIELLDVGNVKDLFNEINTKVKGVSAPSYKGTEIQEGQKAVAADLMGTAKGLAETDLGQKQKDAFTTFQEQLGLTKDQKQILEDNIKARETRLSDAETLFKEAYGNKEQNRTDDLIAFLVGAGGTSGIGETLGRGTEASIRNQKARRNARATATKRLDDLFDKKVTAQENLINKQLDIKNKAFDGSMKDKEIYGSLTEKGLSIMGTLTAEKMKGLSQDATNLINLDVAKFKEEGANLRAELSATSQVRIAQASNVVKVMVANLEGKLDQERIAVEKEIKTLIEQGNQERALSTALNHISRTIASTQAGYTKIYQGIISELQETKSMLPDSVDTSKIDELIKFYQEEEQLQISGAVDELKAISDIYLQKLESIGGVSSGFSVTKKSP